MFCLITSSKLCSPEFEFSLKVKVMGLNPGYLLKSFLLYKETNDIPPNFSSFDFFDMKSMQFKFGMIKKNQMLQR